MAPNIEEFFLVLKNDSGNTNPLIMKNIWTQTLPFKKMLRGVAVTKLIHYGGSPPNLAF